MYVPVTMQLKYQQSFFEVLKVPQIQFIDNGWIFLVCCRDGTHSANCAGDRRDSSGAALALVLDMPVVVHRQVPTVVKVVDISVVAQRPFPLVLTVQKTIVILQLQFTDKVFDVRVVQVQQFLRVQSVRRQSRSHSCSSLQLDTVVHVPVVVRRQMPDGSDVRKL